MKIMTGACALTTRADILLLTLHGDCMVSDDGLESGAG